MRRWLLAAPVGLVMVVGGLLPVQVACASEARETDEAPGVIRVGGEARIRAAPDRATLRMAVVTEDRRSAAAAARNAEASDAVIAALRKALGPTAKIRTAGYSLTPQYEYVKERGRELRGYIARNTVELRTRALDQVGRAIDAASGAGANEISALVFDLADDRTLRMRALAEATQDARSKARAIASALEVPLGRVLSVEEAGGGAPPVRLEQRMAAMAEQAAPTPIEAGEIEVHARVALSVAIGP